MKKRMILFSALIMLIVVACVKNDRNDERHDGEAAYLSMKVKTQSKGRASGEDQGEQDESDLNAIYLLTFDASGNILGIPASNEYFTVVHDLDPEPFKVSSVAESLLAIANPGDKLKAFITNKITGGVSFSTINAAIENIKTTEITGNGFTMINSGDEDGLQVNDKITSPLINIKSYIVKVSEHDGDEAAAKAEAAGKIVDIKIERIAAKLDLKLKSTIDVVPAVGSFDFLNWTLDALNTTFYPFAEKTILGVNHNPNGSYVNNFYTQDPNFLSTSAVGAGLEITQIDPDTYDPIVVMPWMDKDEYTYCVENTMDAPEQKYGNATRVVIKGIYYPDANWSGDWFSFAGENYQTLALLKAAYNVAGAENLQNACDAMYAKIAAYAVANSITLDGSDFNGLSENDLSKIKNGGEVVKDGKNPVIRWYQGGLNYYYYEIRHDNETTIEMNFGKYGVVRNNHYSLTLGKINGSGTPWYPSIDEPGPGDPDPTDPIDESAGFLGIELEIAPWIIWNNEIDI